MDPPYNHYVLGPPVARYRRRCRAGNARIVPRTNGGELPECDRPGEEPCCLLPATVRDVTAELMTTITSCRSASCRKAMAPTSASHCPGWPSPARRPRPGRSSDSSAPRGALSYPRHSREELGGRFLGLMAYLMPKGLRDKSMPA